MCEPPWGGGRWIDYLRCERSADERCPLLTVQRTLSSPVDVMLERDILCGSSSTVHTLSMKRRVKSSLNPYAPPSPRRHQVLAEKASEQHSIPWLSRPTGHRCLLFVYLCSVCQCGWIQTLASDLGKGGWPRMMSAAFSAIIMVGAFRLPLHRRGSMGA